MNVDKKSITMMRIQIVIEPDGDYFFGWSPDLEGVMVEGDTEDDTKDILKEAILVHIEGMLKNNLPLPANILEQDSSRLKQKYKKNSQRQNRLFDSTHTTTETTELQMSFA